MERAVDAHDRAPNAPAPDPAERFPFTKFLPPAVDASTAGPRVARLTQMLADHRVVLVRAPAGSGKTTLLASWAATAPRPVAWLRVDAGDTDADLLAAALHASVSRVVPSLGRRVPAVLAGRGVSRGPRALATALVNDLANATDLVLVLDDLHAIGPDAATLLALLVDLLPSHVRVLAASRSAPPWPVARLRVRGELGELDAADLRLGIDDVRRVLATQGSTDDAVAERVLAASGGWAAAVRLAATAVPVGAMDPTAGDVPTDRVRAEVWEYLAEEVLHTQPPDVHAFLLETCLLDELRPDVCAAVTGRPDAGAVLSDLEARDLFVARFHRTDVPVWRYHDLFADFLRDRLLRERGAAAVAELHRRAASALPPLAALPHLIEAGEFEEAAERIAEAAFWAFGGSMLPHLVTWLDRLPSELVANDPRMVIVRAWHADVAGRSQEARAAVEPLWRRLIAEGRVDDATDLGLQLMGSLLALNDLDTFDEVMQHNDRPGLDAARRVGMFAARMWREWHRRDAAAMSVMLETAFDLALQEAPLPGAGTGTANLLAPSLTSPLLFGDRGPAWLLERAGRLDAYLGPDEEVSRLPLRVLTAAASLLDLDVATADTELRAVLAASDAFGRIAWTHQDAESLLLVLLLTRGDRGAVMAVVDAASEARASSAVYERWWPAYAYAALRAAPPKRDARVLRSLTARYLPESLLDTSPTDAIVRGVAAAWLAVACGSAPDGREPLLALAAAEEAQAATRAWLFHGLPGLERGSLLLEAGRATAAVDAAEPTLAAAGRYGAGILLSEAEPHRALLTRCAAAGLHADVIAAALRTVDAAGAGRALDIPGSGESLTAREVDVLRLVAAGHANRGVAEELGIAEATVKTHMTRVLGKLGATSRTQAVARARELYLL